MELVVQWSWPFSSTGFSNQTINKGNSFKLTYFGSLGRSNWQMKMARVESSSAKLNKSFSLSRSDVGKTHVEVLEVGVWQNQIFRFWRKWWVLVYNAQLQESTFASINVLYIDVKINLATLRVRWSAGAKEELSRIDNNAKSFCTSRPCPRTSKRISLFITLISSWSLAGCSASRNAGAPGQQQILCQNVWETIQEVVLRLVLLCLLAVLKMTFKWI